MKYDYERIALWAIVIILVVAVFFQQRRSGFTLQAGADTMSVSMMDLMEFGSVPAYKRSMYKTMITSNSTSLSTMTGIEYKTKLDQIMFSALNMPTPPSVPPPGEAPIPPHLMACSNAIVFDTCTSSTTCPIGMQTRMVGNLKFCMCPATMPYMNAPMTSGGIPVCVASCPTYATKRLTLLATGQVMCVANCPSLLAPGMTCI